MDQNVSTDASPTFVAGTFTGAIAGATTVAVQGAAYFGSNTNATVSTFTAAGAATFAASVTAPAITGTTSVSGGSVIATSGAVRLVLKTKAELRAITPVDGDIYKCSDCSPKKIALSTGGAVGMFGDALGAQLQ